MSRVPPPAADDRDTLVAAGFSPGVALVALVEAAGDVEQALDIAAEIQGSNEPALQIWATAAATLSSYTPAIVTVRVADDIAGAAAAGRPPAGTSLAALKDV